jgi:hypothetical protein
MDDDDLRNMLSDVDPARSSPPVTAAADAAAQQLLENIVNTNLDMEPTAPVSELPRRPRRRFGVALVAAAAAIAAIAVGVGIVARDDAKTTTVSLALPGSNVMGSCIAFDPTFLAQMQTAFRGTVTGVADDGTVTLSVDHWYKTDGERADIVTLHGAVGDTAPTLEGGVEFAEGQTYLVTATDGNVNGCGFSGLVTPELQAAFDTAFGS